MATKKNYNTPIEYETDERGFSFLILRKYRIIKGILKTVNCPFCGYKHHHGVAEGHRCGHCGSGDLKNPTIIHSDGTILNSRDGYIIRY